MITIKTPFEINIMREGGLILANILEQLMISAIAGMKTKELDLIAEKLIKKYQVQASFKNYRGYPSSTCVSVNEEVVHGIPGEKILKPGDIVKIDCGILHKNFHTDSAVTVMLEPVSQKTKTFIHTVKNALYRAIDLIKPGAKIGDLSYLIEQTIKRQGYSSVHELTGHGIGKCLHEDPVVPNYGLKNSGPALMPGMTFAVEPIINMGNRFIKTLADGWTIVTADNSLSAQFEHTVAVTQNGVEILTKK